MDRGVYIALFWLDRGRRIAVGSLGRLEFPRGLYAYVGSAQRGLSHRLARHAAADKPLRWHIDYLSVHAPMCAAVVVRGDKSLECRLARALSRRFVVAAPRFGSSDCRCAGHLFVVSGDVER